MQPVRRKCSQEGAADDVQWCSFRKSLPWIEGHDIPSMAWEFAQGVLTCETVYVVAEVDEQAMKEGVPPVCDGVYRHTPGCHYLRFFKRLEYHLARSALPDC